jgi:hypothetical protein
MILRVSVWYALPSLTSPGLLYFPDAPPPPAPPPPPPPVFAAPPPAFLADFFPAYVTARRVADAPPRFLLARVPSFLDTNVESRARVPVATPVVIPAASIVFESREDDQREREIERETFPSSIASVDPTLPRVSVVSRQCRFSARPHREGGVGFRRDV